MTTDHGSHGSGNDSPMTREQLMEALGALPAEVLRELDDLPPEFLVRLSELSPGAQERMACLPVSILAALSQLPSTLLEWLGAVGGVDDASADADLLVELIRAAHTAPGPLKRLSELPDSLTDALMGLPEEVTSGLLTLPPELLRQLPMALSAQMETVDEIPEGFASENDSEDIAPELTATLDELSPEATASLASLSPEAMNALAGLDADSIASLASLPPALLSAMGAKSGAGGSGTPTDRSAMLALLSGDAVDALRTIDESVLQELAGSLRSKQGIVVPQSLFRGLGQGGGRMLGGLVGQARSLKDVQGRDAADSDDAPSYEEAAPTMSEIPDLSLELESDDGDDSDDGDGARTTLIAGYVAPGDESDQADVSEEDGAERTLDVPYVRPELILPSADPRPRRPAASNQDTGGMDTLPEVSATDLEGNSDDSLADADEGESGDAGATVQDVVVPVDDDDSFAETVNEDWSEGLSALESGEVPVVDRGGLESGDFSQIINPEGISEDDSDSYGGTVQSDDVDVEKLRQEMDDDESADSYSQTLMSDDDSDASGDAGATVQDVMLHSPDDADDSFAQTVQSNDGWGTEGLSALDEDRQTVSDDDDSYSQTVQVDDDGSAGDDSFAQTVQSDEWSSDGLSALDRADGSGVDKTVQSDEWSKHEFGTPGDSDDDSFSQTVQSGQSFGGMTTPLPSDDDDSYSQTVQTDDSFDSAGSHDDSFGATVQSNDGSFMQGTIRDDDDSFGATVQSGEFGSDELGSSGNTDDSFAQTIQTEGSLSPAVSSEMAKAWGEDFGKSERPNMTIKSESKKTVPPKNTLVITPRKFSTSSVKDLEKSGLQQYQSLEPEYELLSKLGEGGMGIVFMARQRSIDREVALKMLKPKTAKDKDQRAKFLSEAVVTGDLDHPNIVPIYDVGSSPDDALFYAMKKVEGKPWLDVIKDKSLDENLEILMRCSDAVAFAHSRGIIHRDLKPENVMLGPFNVTLVMDWGLAYSTKEFRKSASITESTSMGGTPAYMAPEMATGPINKIGPHSDVYLLGAILFEVVTGKPPHAGRNAMKCLMAAARNQIREPDPEVTKRNDPTGELVAIAMKAMETKPQDRYQTVEDLQDAIRGYLSHTESVTLTLRAADDLRTAIEKQDYDTFARARFGYEEAINLWANNRNAQKGLVEARLEYAKCAQSNDDLDLGMSLLDPQNDDRHRRLYEELQAAKDLRLAKERELEEQKAAGRRMRKILAAVATVAFFAVSGFGVFAEMQRQEADYQRGVAVENEKEAVKQKEEADRQRGIAEEQQIIAQRNAEEALRQKEEAERQTSIAVMAQKEEAKQRAIAQTNLDLAVKNEKLAKDNEMKAVASAEEAEKQRKAAEANAEEAKKQEALAKANEKKANENAEEAKKQELLAKKNADEAIKNAEEAEKQRKIAVANAEEAVRQEKLAVAARDEALAAKEAEELAKKQEQYQAYIARIGLADSKIRENAFDTALTILNDCPPDLRNWEWGRLMHLCNQSMGTFNNQAPVDAIDVSPDGKWFVTGGWNSEAVVWSVRTGQPQNDLRLKHDGLYVYAVDWSADGQWIATGSNDAVNGFVQIFNSQTGERVSFPNAEVGIRDRHSDAVLSVKFSRDGSKLLTAGYDGTARLWDTKSGELIKRYIGHTWWVWSAEFSPDEEQIVTASQDGSCIVWNTDTAEVFKGPFKGHDGPAYSATFSPDGLTVASGGYDRRVLLWQPALVQEFDFRRLSSGGGSVVPAPNFTALDGHAGPVRSVVYSADGTQIVSGSQDNTLRLWNTESRLVEKVFRGHDGSVQAVQFTEQDSILLSGSADGTIRKWNIEEYEEIRAMPGQVLEGHADAILSARFSPGGDQIVTASRDRSARTWNSADGQQVKTLVEGHSFLATSAVFFQGGKRLATGAVDNTVRIWDTDSGTQLSVLEHTGRAAAMAASSDGKWLITGSDARSVQIWDVATGQRIQELTGHPQEVTAVAITADNRQLLSGDSGGNVRLWDVESGSVVHELNGHGRGRITGAAFLPGTNRGLTASADKSVAQWNLETGDEDRSLLLKHSDSVNSMVLREGTHQVLTVSNDGIVRLWDADTAAIVAVYDSQDAIDTVSIDAQGVWALGADTKSEKVHLWQLDQITNKEFAPPQKSVSIGRRLWTAVFDPTPGTQNILALGGSEARRINANDDSVLTSYSPQGIVASANYSHDGKWIVTASWDSAARIWNAETAADVGILKGHDGNVNSAVFSPDDRFVLTASDDGSAKLWNLESQEVVQTFSGHVDGIVSAVFSKNGSRVLTASRDKTARVWDTQTGKELAVLRGHVWPVLSAEFSDDGSLAITGSEDNTALIWNVETGEQLQVLRGHTASVTSVCFAPGANPTRALTGSRDGSVKVWDTTPHQNLPTVEGEVVAQAEAVAAAADGAAADQAAAEAQPAATADADPAVADADGSRQQESQKEILTLDGHTREVTSVCFSPDGRQVLTASQDGRAILWLTDDWKKAADALADETGEKVATIQR